jgi:hypothetical protein
MYFSGCILLSDTRCIGAGADRGAKKNRRNGEGLVLDLGWLHRQHHVSLLLFCYFLIVIC